MDPEGAARGGVSGGGRDFLFQVLQFLEEERLTAVARKYASTATGRGHPPFSHEPADMHPFRLRFEQETRIYLSLQYVEDVINAGKWGELEDYLTSFTRLTDNRYSLKAFFEIRKQKFLEALDRRGH